MERTDDYIRTLIGYYSFDKEGQPTIALHYCALDYCKEHPYCVLSNGGVAMLWMKREELAQFTALCAEMRVIIDTINEH